MKTGSQVFKTAIFDNIDNTIEVISVQTAPGSETNKFTVCNAKWAVPGGTFTDPDNFVWPITVVDFDTNEIWALSPSDDAVPIFYGEVLSLRMPEFWSGTRANVNDELAARQADSVAQIGPIIWLKEVIRLRIPPQSGPKMKKFQFTWACLNFYDDLKHLNADRHNLVLYPMTQLGQETLDTIDRVVGLERPGYCESFEFSRFATEGKDGFEKLIIDLSLSGTSYTADVEVDETHYCKC